MKNTLLFAGLLFVNFQFFAQSNKSTKSFYQTYDWTAQPKKYDLTAEQADEKELILFERRATELLNADDGALVEYRFLHTITRLNSDAAIEDNNKYYVSNYTADKIIYQKARAIQPDGSIIEVSNADIKESLNEEGNVEYQYFAFEGIQLGSVIEYLQLIKFEPYFKGSVFLVQSNIPKLEAHYDLITPKYLEYEIFTVNGLEKLKRDSTKIDFIKYSIDLFNVEPLRSETSSSYKANLKKIYFKLDKNYSTGKANFFNYQNISKEIYDYKFKAISKKERKLILGLLKDAELKDTDSEVEKIQKIEKQVKKEFIVLNFNINQFEDIQNIFKGKIASEAGLSNIMLNAFRESNIPFEIAITTDRTINKFYKEYEAWNFLDEILFYFPGSKMYLSPNVNSRLGFVPYEYTGTNGLFIKETKIGSISTFESKVKFIDYPSSDKSKDIINTVVSLNDELTEAKIDIERITSGYKAYFYQAYMDYYDDERKKESQTEYLNYIDKDAEVKDMEFENADTDLLGIKPYIGKGKIVSTNFTENAGNKVLFKIGSLIGPQAEMYNEKERKIPVETEFTRKYERKIIFEVPDGYKVKNPEVLNMNVIPEMAKQPIGFTSTYVIEGNKIIVTVNEWYDELTYPLESYENYKNVINAAADFNKLVLVLEKI